MVKIVLAEAHPGLAAQWHPEKNGDLTPEQVTSGSHKKVWWRCQVDSTHEWPAEVKSRVSGNGCPICAGLLVTPTTSLQALYPNLAAEWHPTNNGTLTPDKVRPGSEKKVWWLCQRNREHAWPSIISNRVKGSGCPICANKQATPATSLQAFYPALAAEWHPTKNGDLTPLEVLPGSHKKVWWRCQADLSHEWPAVIDRRVKGNGCPKCSGRDVTPTTSLRILYPQLAAEWHPTKNGNLTPDDVKPGSNQKVWWLCPLDPSHEWLAQVAKRVKGNGCQRCRGQIATPTTSLQALYPDLAAEWHPTKNSDLLPDQVRPGSGKKVWWCCTNNHEWQAAIYSRASGNGCQICSGRVATIMTSLRVLYPELAAEWHSEKNRALTPEDVLPGSSRRVWWRCLINPDHEWSATIITRTKHHTGCPLCASLSTLYPQLSVEWHPEKNKDLTPDQVTPGSNRKVWWRCLHDHEWVASIYQRVKGSGCGFCEGRIVTSTNSLYAVYPHLAMEWHLTKNETLTPYDVLPGSGRKVWWQCLKGHEWDATIVMRKEGTGCPSCSGRVATPDTSLQALRPDLAMEWHPTKNGTVTPDQVKPGTDKKVWWQCQKDLSHEWEALIYNRTAGYGGCPHCREMSGSALEDFFAHLLDTEHILYERQKSIGPWHVDFYLPEHAVILEVQGCYWHGCLQCGYDTEMHRDKRRRDSQRKRYLHWKKYQIEEIWEHELHQNAEAILARIKEKYQAKDK